MSYRPVRPNDDAVTIYPLDPELPFLLWIEEVRKHLPDNAEFDDSTTLHRVYYTRGLEGAVGWLEHSILHPVSKGSQVPSYARGYNLFLAAILGLGISNPVTRESTKRIILKHQHLHDQGGHYEAEN